jgi:hypothetical protein
MNPQKKAYPIRPTRARLSTPRRDRVLRASISHVRSRGKVPLISLKPVVPGLLLVTACGASTPKAPRGEVSSGKPCDEVIPDCRARRLANVVLRNGAADGSLFSVDGLDTSGVLTFDEALHAAWKNDFRGESDTVQVILGAADVWGTEAGLYYAVKWAASARWIQAQQTMCLRVHTAATVCGAR